MGPDSPLMPYPLIVLMLLLGEGNQAVVPRAPMAPEVTVTRPAEARAPGQDIAWPEQLQPLARLEGPALIAAHAALQRLLEGLPKEYAGSCSHSAKAMEILVGQQGGLYFVQINQRVEQCGGFAPGFTLSPDWLELYAVSPEGAVLARYPHQP
mgnify:CR=1 FL=1